MCRPIVLGSGFPWEVGNTKWLADLPQRLQNSFPRVAHVHTLVHSVMSYLGDVQWELAGPQRQDRVSVLPHAVLFERDFPNWASPVDRCWLRTGNSSTEPERFQNLTGPPTQGDLQVQQDFSRWQGLLLDVAARRAILLRTRASRPGARCRTRVACNLSTLECTALVDGSQTRPIPAMELIEYLSQNSELVHALVLDSGQTHVHVLDPIYPQDCNAFVHETQIRPDSHDHHSTTLLVRYRRCLRATLLALLHYSRDSVSEVSMRNGASGLEFLRNTGLFYPRADASEPLVFPACKALHLSTSIKDAIKRGDPALDPLVSSQFPIADVTVDPPKQLPVTRPFGRGAGMAQP